MVDISGEFLGVKSINPFWLASGPPTDKAYNVIRAFEAGWGGVVWKTLGFDPPIVNVGGSRYGAVWGADRRVQGFSNIELITDRPLETNLEEIRQVKKDWPDRPIFVSLMVPCEESCWAEILQRVADTGCDGFELNFGCPHGMSERGMGSAVGQVPDYIEMVTQWAKSHISLPVIVKLTPNVANIQPMARAAQAGGADAVSLINTVASIIGVNLDTFTPEPAVGSQGTHGGYSGPAVKPIALHMVAEIARDPETQRLPISAIGGITTWHDAAEFLSLGASNLQVCTAAMTYGFKVVQEMESGLKNWMREAGFQSLNEFIGRAVPNTTDWEHLNLNYVTKAFIDQDKCIKCGRCYIACEDTSHQAISNTLNGERHYEIIDEKCVGCNLCLNVCPVTDCITMIPVAPGNVDPRTGQLVPDEPLEWINHPNNPDRTSAD